MTDKDTVDRIVGEMRDNLRLTAHVPYQPEYLQDAAQKLSDKLSNDVAARLNNAVRRALPVWIRRWEGTLPLWALKLISRWYRVEIRHRTEETLLRSKLVWEVFVDGKMVEKVEADYGKRV